MTTIQQYLEVVRENGYPNARILHDHNGRPYIAIPNKGVKSGHFKYMRLQIPNDIKLYDTDPISDESNVHTLID